MATAPKPVTSIALGSNVTIHGREFAPVSIDVNFGGGFHPDEAIVKLVPVEREEPTAPKCGEVWREADGTLWLVTIGGQRREEGAQLIALHGPWSIGKAYNGAFDTLAELREDMFDADSRAMHRGGAEPFTRYAANPAEAFAKLARESN